MFVFSQKTCSIFEAMWFHFETVLEFSLVLFALQLHFLKLRSDSKIVHSFCVFICIKNWGSYRIVVKALEVYKPLYFTTLYLGQMYIPQLLKFLSSAQEILLMGPQHQDLECLLEVLLLAGIICLDNCLDSMEIDVWLEYRSKMMLQKALQDCLFPFQTELIITAPSAIAHHCPFNSSNKPCFAFFFFLFVNEWTNRFSLGHSGINSWHFVYVPPKTSWTDGTQHTAGSDFLSTFW